MKTETKRNNTRRSFGARVKRGFRYLLRYLMIIGWMLVWPVVRRVVRPKVVFVVYGTNSDQRAYYPGWLQPVIPYLLPIGFLKLNGKTVGFIVGSTLTMEQFEANPEEALKVMQKAKKLLPRARAIALAGRLPSWINKAGGKIVPPFVEGHTGTCYAMTLALLRAAEDQGFNPKEVRLGLLGGAGFVGSRLAETSSHHFGKVVALDPRYEQSEDVGNITKTNDLSQVMHTDVAMVLTGKGDDIKPSVPYLKEGSVVVDDTHPPIPETLRGLIRSRGVILKKAVVGTGGFTMVPRLPKFKAWNIPGCLLEALVVGHEGWEVLSSQHSFVHAAKSFGFRAELIDHPDD